MEGGQKMQEREERRERKNTDEKKEGHIEEISLHLAILGVPRPAGGQGEVGQEASKPSHFLGQLSPTETWRSCLFSQKATAPHRRTQG